MSDDGASVDAVDLGVQAALADGESTRTSRSSTSAVCRAGPPRPRHEQLAGYGGVRARRLRVALVAASPTPTVSRSAPGDDFDAVVLAIPVGMHRIVCDELIENPRTPEWRAMTDHLGTVATQADAALAHGSTRRSSDWHGSGRHRERVPGRVPHVCVDVGTCSRPRHGRRDDRPASIGYFCHVLDDRAIRRPPTTSGTRRASTRACERTRSSSSATTCGTIWPRGRAERRRLPLGACSATARDGAHR